MVGGRARQPSSSTAIAAEVEHLAAPSTDVEREALSTHDYPTLFELGAHPFLTLTLFIAMFERDHDEPLGFQLEYARRLAHFSLPYADIST